ncbi:hypothetical protein [Mesorhizobium sp.]|uniref:hypothetical protein n=1 Tax=Mesorhizobium sp. TaxID=1871066 RepID=UPI0025FFB1E3|nr:hypothetical protein [Mesorhizobium sp.]
MTTLVQPDSAERGQLNLAGRFAEAILLKLVLPDCRTRSPNLTGPADENFKAKPYCAKTVTGETFAKGHNPAHFETACA